MRLLAGPSLCKGSASQNVSNGVFAGTLWALDIGAIIAGEDTGSMFQICARLGTRDNRLQKFGKLLGMLYHGCDDVADVRETTALGGGSAKDIEDAIVTLPVALGCAILRQRCSFVTPSS